MRNKKISIVQFFLLGIAMLMLGTSYAYAQVDVTLPDLTRQFGAQEEIVDIEVSDVTGLGVTSFQFDLYYDYDVITITEVINAGTLSDDGFFNSNISDSLNGHIRVGWANSDPMAGAGALVKLKIRYKDYGTSTLSFVNPSTLVNTFKFNNGTPAADAPDGEIVIPTIAVAFTNLTGTVGDTVDVPVTTTAIVTADGIVTYNFTASFDETVLEFLDAYETDGTLSDNGFVDLNPNNTNGTITVAYAGGSPLAGVGNLIILKAVIVGAGTSVNDFTVFQFNNGNPVAGTVAGSVVASVVSTFSISGTVTYNSTAATPIANAVVTLSGDATGTVTTDATGTYSFTGLVAGNYNVSATKTTGWGGVTSTDALLVQRHFSGFATLDSLQKLAGDVTNNALVNSSDALDIVRRYVNLISVFDKPDWVLLPASSDIVITTESVTNNIKALATGDVNMSLVPSALAKNSLSIFNESALSVSEGESFEVPVRINDNVLLGAVSLRISYPANLLKFEGVSSQLGIRTKEENGVISLAWYDMNGAKFNAKDAIASLKFSSIANGSVNFGLEEGSEFADVEGNVYKGSVSVPNVTVATPREFSLNQNYPNPFNPSTKINYTVPENGNVTLSIYNVTGQEVAKLVNGVQASGSYQVVWNASNLSSGIYFYKLNFEGTNRIYSDIKSMILLK